ncbi:MAG: PQQ-like beta-propeller repeat protein [Thermoguttaceae bacterium]|nr:PQQ-like beta-propeller repeat protein [Thermoguttaceae bacterium]MDW8078502.1 PQQ-binding-like beta-propeller repeat protein [Thermoguttaceae bacterium]
MKHLVIGIALLMVACPVYVRTSEGADWPQYLGPFRNSVSPEKGILRSWPEEGPKVLWTVPVGRGFGGPVIKNGRVYLLDRDDPVSDIVRCLDLVTGKELWRFSYEARGSLPFPGSRSVPAVDDKFVFSCGQNGDFYCIDVTTGNPVWHKNIWTDFGGKQLPMWGITQCPLLYGELVIVASQTPEAGVVAFEKATGKIRWKTPPLGPVGYVSPGLVKIDGEDHVVMVTASAGGFMRRGGGEASSGKVVGIDPRDGKILWEYPRWRCQIPIPTAVDAGDNKVLVAGGYELGAILFKVEKNADGTYQTKEILTTTDFGEHTKPPLFYNGYFFGQYTTNARRDGLVCMSVDGQIRWRTGRSPVFNKGSMILVDGLILATDGMRRLYLIEPDPQEFKVLASAELLGQEGTSTEGMARMGGPVQNWAPIALSDGKLLIRDHTQMKCVLVR